MFQQLYIPPSMDSALQQSTECIGNIAYKQIQEQGLRSRLALRLCRTRSPGGSSLLNIRGKCSALTFLGLTSSLLLLTSTRVYLQNSLLLYRQSKGKEAFQHLARNSEPQLLRSVSLTNLIGDGLGHYRPSHHKVIRLFSKT